MKRTSPCSGEQGKAHDTVDPAHFFFFRIESVWRSEGLTGCWFLAESPRGFEDRETLVPGHTRSDSGRVAGFFYSGDLRGGHRPRRDNRTFYRLRPHPSPVTSDIIKHGTHGQWRHCSQVAPAQGLHQSCRTRSRPRHSSACLYTKTLSGGRQTAVFPSAIRPNRRMRTEIDSGSI